MLNSSKCLDKWVRGKGGASKGESGSYVLLHMVANSALQVCIIHQKGLMDVNQKREVKMAFFIVT